MNRSIIKLSSRFLMLGVLAGSLWFYTGYSFSQANQLQVVAAKQPGSPLLIQITYVDSSNPLQPHYQYSVTNVGDKPVRAYTIKESTSLDTGAPVVHTDLANFPAVTQFLTPYGVRQEEGGLSSTYQVPPIKVELSVDFVELADGTRWGDDTAKSGDCLDGMRAGGKAAIKRYREVLAGQGDAGLDRALSNDNPVVYEGQPKSDEWARGFDMGVGFVRGRIKRAKEKGGKDEARRELDKPYDSSEGRQDL
jgi:hypothetical protein